MSSDERDAADIPPSSWLPPLKRGPTTHELQSALRRIEKLVTSASAQLSDPLERSHVLSWLNRLFQGGVSVAEDEEGDSQDLIDDAAAVLEQVIVTDSAVGSSDSGDRGAKASPADASLERVFCFPFDFSRPNAQGKRNEGDDNQITVSLIDEELPPSTTSDTSKEAALAVGVQTWAAAIVLSDLLVTRGGDIHERLSSSSSSPLKVMELGAGTGLVGLVCARLLQRLASPQTTPHQVILTDYHPLVLANLERNVQANSASQPFTPDVDVTTMHLDWSASHDNGYAASQDLLVAADVVYSPTHAQWLYTTICALLARNDASRAHILNAKRMQGRFGEWGLVDGTDAAFDAGFVADGWKMTVLRRVDLPKQKGLGRSDESGHVWWTLGWRRCEQAT